MPRRGLVLGADGTGCTTKQMHRDIIAPLSLLVVFVMSRVLSSCCTSSGEVSQELFFACFADHAVFVARISTSLGTVYTYFLLLSCLTLAMNSQACMHAVA